MHSANRAVFQNGREAQILRTWNFHVLKEPIAASDVYTALEKTNLEGQYYWHVFSHTIFFENPCDLMMFLMVYNPHHG